MFNKFLVQKNYFQQYWKAIRVPINLGFQLLKLTETQVLFCGFEGHKKYLPIIAKQA